MSSCGSSEKSTWMSSVLASKIDVFRVESQHLYSHSNHAKRLLRIGSEAIRAHIHLDAKFPQKVKAKAKKKAKVDNEKKKT